MLNRSLTNGNKRGAILFGVLIVVLTISLIGASLIALLSTLHISSQYEVNQAKALYLAEAGINHAVHALQSQVIIIAQEENFIPPTQLGDGTYEVKLDISQSLITSIGKVGAVKRKIQLKYSSF